MHLDRLKPLIVTFVVDDLAAPVDESGVSTTAYCNKNLNLAKIDSCHVKQIQLSFRVIHVPGFSSLLDLSEEGTSDSSLCCEGAVLLALHHAPSLMNFELLSILAVVHHKDTGCFLGPKIKRWFKSCTYWNWEQVQGR